MLVCIHQPNFLPRAKVLDKMLAADLTIYLDDVQYVPREWQNRALVKGPQGDPHWLSVPVFTKGKSRPPILECELADSPVWRRKQVATIRQSYAKSQWLDLFDEKLAPLWSQSDGELASFCIGSTERLLSMLDRTIESMRSQDIEDVDSSEEEMHLPAVEENMTDAPERRTARLLRLCKAVGATGYLCGSGGITYLRLDQFTKAGIQVYLQRDPETQLSAWRRMSALDAILTQGPQPTQANLLTGQFDEL